MHEAEVERKELERAGLLSRLRLQLRRRGASLDPAALVEPARAEQVLAALEADGDGIVRELAGRLRQLLQAPPQAEAATIMPPADAQTDKPAARAAVRDYRYGARGGWGIQG
ncbi:hypothetical protein GPA19_17680 [Azoarcus indigens]|uniref:Uncharacterized protein n=1 Tax=Azoarcus indigens TaxID=29545 RepID=A0A4V3BNF1_9RHOO|nr:hypothetical protein [Azoarcus indigens]NMG66772.1 hypothetical protein [Azoarcus indigens]TDN53502.1 hypothetical protein C7389_105177 [Azoarcus indigens]